VPFEYLKIISKLLYEFKPHNWIPEWHETIWNNFLPIILMTRTTDCRSEINFAVFFFYGCFLLSVTFRELTCHYVDGITERIVIQDGQKLVPRFLLFWWPDVWYNGYNGQESHERTVAPMTLYRFFPPVIDTESFHGWQSADTVSGDKKKSRPFYIIVAIACLWSIL